MNGCCIAKNKYFAELMQVEELTVQRNLQVLQRFTCIKIEYDGNKRKIKIPQFASFDEVESFTFLESGNTTSQSKVLDLVDLIKEKQIEKYPYIAKLLESTLPIYGQMRQIILTLAKSVCNPDYLGVKLGKQKVTEQMLWDLVSVFDIGKCHDLSYYLVFNSEKVKDVERYILTSLFNLFEVQIKKLEHQRKLNRVGRGTA